MDKHKQREALAGLNGWTGFHVIEGGRHVGYKRDGELREVFKYSTHDEIQYIINKLGTRQIFAYERRLVQICAAVGKNKFKASPCQKIEAILRIKGLWVSE